MKLIKTWVKLYRNVVDSGELSIEDSVTCLVGKNESGKTALLKALYSLNPHNPNLVDLNTTKDYPRWLKRKGEREGNLGDVTPITAVFSLDEDDIDYLNGELNIPVPKNVELYVKRSYNNELISKLESSEEDWIKSILNSNIIKEDIKTDVFKPKTIEEFITKLNDLHQERKDEISKEEPSTEDTEEGSEEVKSSEEVIEEPDEKLNDIESAITKVEFIQIIKNENIDEKFITSIKARLPTFFYYNSYSSLKGQINLDKTFEMIDQEKEDMNIEDETSIALLKLAGITKDNIPYTDFEELIAELEAAASDITQQVLEYWTQNKNLRVIFQLEPRIKNDPLTGKNIDYKCLNIRLNDLRHYMTTNFSTRSSGFQWFFSFIIAFSDFEGRDDVILLLDEPGLGLHALAQKDLLKFIEKKLGKDRQVIFTNHSPFLINPQKLENVRLVEISYIQ